MVNENDEKAKKRNRKWRGSWGGVSASLNSVCWEGSLRRQHLREGLKEWGSERCRCLGKNFLARGTASCKGPQVEETCYPCGTVGKPVWLEQSKWGKSSRWQGQSSNGFFGRVVMVSRSDRVLYAVVRTLKYILNMVGGHEGIWAVSLCWLWI